MDLEAGRNPSFEDYAKNVIGGDKWNASEGRRVYGITQLGQRFVLMLIYSLNYYVYLVIEPDANNSGSWFESIVPYSTFVTKDSAHKYIENKHIDLQSQSKIFDLNVFDNYVAQKSKMIWGCEVYRIRDFDVKGNPFVIILKKSFSSYTVVIFKDPGVEPQIYITKNISRKTADEYIQQERNKLNGVAATYVYFYFVKTVSFLFTVTNILVFIVSHYVNAQ